MKRAVRFTNTAIGCHGVVLAMAGSRVWAAPRNQSQTPPYTFAEYNAFKAQSEEQDAQVRIRLLDDFTAQYPDSVMMPYIYKDYYQTYLVLRNFPQAVATADKLLVLAVEEDTTARLIALSGHAVAYSAGCDDSALRTPEASVRAKATAAQGLQLLSQWQKPLSMPEATFASAKTYYGMTFTSAEGIAESRLKGDPVVCVQPPQMIDPGRFRRVIQDLQNEQRQSPRVR
jgi:hypothetical protein